MATAPLGRTGRGFWTALAIFVLLSLFAWVVRADKYPKRYLIADLPTCTNTESLDARAYAVIDPVDSLDCILGTGTPVGSVPHLCMCDGGTATYVLEGAGGGAPTTADYLTGTAQVGLSAEIVVGPTPQGELGGTWALPTVDATHAGSAHHSVFAPNVDPGVDHSSYVAGHGGTEHDAFLPLDGSSPMTGALLLDNLGLDFEESDTNPGCSAGDFLIYADLTDAKLKKCQNGSVEDLDTTGGTPSFSDITGGTNTSAAMVVGSGASILPGLGSPQGIIGSTHFQIQAFNDTGAILFKCTAVHFTGAIDIPSDLPEIGIADADDPSKMPAAGIVSQDIPAGSAGFIILGGAIGTVDTQGGGWAIGNQIFVNTNGTSIDTECSNTLTNIEPTGATAEIQQMGTVGRVNNINGAFTITGAGRANELPNMGADELFVGTAPGVATPLLISDLVQEFAPDAGDFVLGELAGGGGIRKIDVDDLHADVRDEWHDYSRSFFDEVLKLTVTGGATNTFTLEEASVIDGELELNINGIHLRMTSPSTLDLSTVEGGGNPVDDGLPFSYFLWVEETGGPGACAADSLDCAVLGGTLNSITAQEYRNNALLASVVVQTPATVNTLGPAFVGAFFHELGGSAANVQNVAGLGGGKTPGNPPSVTGVGTLFLNINEIGWVTARGIMVVPASPMVSVPYYILGALADAAGQEPLDAVNITGDITETTDGVAIGANDYFHVVIFQGVFEKAGISYSRPFLTLPDCTYAANRLSDARDDVNSCAVYTVPEGFRETEFLARVLIQNDTDFIEQIDLAASVGGGLVGTGGTVVGPPSVTPGNAVVFDGSSGQLIGEPPTAPSEDDVLTVVGGVADWVAPSAGSPQSIMRSGVALRGFVVFSGDFGAPQGITGINQKALSMGFDASLLECGGGLFFVPAGVSGLTARMTWVWWSETQTTGSEVWEFHHLEAGDGASWDVAKTVEAAAADTVAGTLRQYSYATLDVTVASLGWTSGNVVNFEICGNGPSSTISGISHLRAWQLEWVTP